MPSAMRARGPTFFLVILISAWLVGMGLLVGTDRLQQTAEITVVSELPIAATLANVDYQVQGDGAVFWSLLMSAGVSAILPSQGGAIPMLAVYVVETLGASDVTQATAFIDGGVTPVLGVVDQNQVYYATGAAVFQYFYENVYVSALPIMANTALSDFNVQAWLAFTMIVGLGLLLRATRGDPGQGRHPNSVFYEGSGPGERLRRLFGYSMARDEVTNILARAGG